MAKKWLTHLNLNQNELQNAAIQPLATAPSSPVAGQVYFDTTLNQFGVYDGTSWVYMGEFDGSGYVDTTTNQTVGGVKTFSSFPVTPSTSPSTNYQVANKKYVDDSIQDAGGYTNKQAQDAVGGILTDTATLDFTYDSPNATITADVLNSPLLGGNNAAYYLNRTNHTGTQSTDTLTDGTNSKVFTNADNTKLDYITVTETINLDDLSEAVEALEAAVVLKGTWDASTGSFPGGGSAQAGWSYIVSTGGTVNGITFDANDRIVAITDNASTSTYAGNWFKLDYTDQVLSVNGQTGAVSLDTSDVDDSSNRRYVTDAQLTVIGNTSGTNTGDEPDATTTVKGIVELATTAETTARSSTTLAVTPSGLASFPRKYSATVGGSSSITVTHSLGNADVITQVREVATNEVVECDIVNTNTNTVTLGFADAPAASSLRVVVIG